MLSSEEQQRYQKHLLLEGFGTEAQEKLKAAKVLVVGAGGLGCPVLMYLAAAGVGHIGIIDADVVDISNLQRQVLYSQNDLGQLKAEVAAQKLHAQNPLIHCQAIPQRLSRANAKPLIEQYDLVVDCTDNFEVRYLINDVCVHLAKAFVYGAIHRFEGQVSVFNFKDEKGCLGPSYRCVFPEKPDGLLIPNCAEVGVLGILPGLVGMYQANEAIKMICGIGEVLSGRLLILDLLANSQQKIKIKRRADAEQIINKQNLVTGGTTYTDLNIQEIEALKNKIPNLLLLDVRNNDEFERYHLAEALHIPLGQLLLQINQLKPNAEVVVYCQSGKRSLAAIEMLATARPDITLYNLQGGLNAC